MAKKEFTTVKTHPRHVKPSLKNPNGITVVDQHLRRLPGTFLDAKEIENIFKDYNRDKIKYPAVGKLKEYKNSDKYDGLIAVWTDYFNKILNSESPMDPDILKALIASESGFDPAPSKNKKALGIAQITKSAFKALQDPAGETKDFIFSKFLQKDLNDPKVAIPMAVRWLSLKRKMATKKLKREPTAEEIILEYKGLLKSDTDYKKAALKNFKRNYDLLKK